MFPLAVSMNVTATQSSSQRVERLASGEWTKEVGPSNLVKLSVGISNGNYGVITTGNGYPDFGGWRFPYKGSDGSALQTFSAFFILPHSFFLSPISLPTSF